MVPANDEHKSTNATGENTSTHKNFFEKLKFWKRRDEDEHEPARLTAMPDCLMHWWTPVLFALILLAAGCFLASIWRMPLRPLSWEKINPLWPPSWPFNYHWPSKDAMALCATIAGAGFAFSAWQQRSHDNVVKEKQAQATVEREDYWKRREHIFQLLGSKNPGLRLGAVALLAELADSVARSTLLNDTEKQQLQRHIIDTLCLQVRHEGQAADTAKNSNEHSKIQQLIIDTILKRANVNKTNNSLANWSHQIIDLSDSNIITVVYISNFKTQSLINFNGSHFFKPVTIRQSTIGRILWQTATFDSFLTVGDFAHPTKFGTDGFPHQIDSAEFYNTTIITDYAYMIDRSPSSGSPLSGLMVKSCTFLYACCNCPTSCYCKLKGDACLCKFQLECNCKNKCFTHGEIAILDQTDLPKSTKRKPKLQIIGCTAGRIYIEFNNSSSNIFLSHNSIEDEIYISLSSELKNNQVSQPSKGKPGSPKSQITLHKNTSLEGNTPASIAIQTTNETLATEYINITQEL